jgi:hypothetical protein
MLQTTSWSRVILEKLIIAQLFNKFPTFYRSRGFITVFTGPFTEPKESSSQILNLFLYIFVNTAINFVLSQLWHIPIHIQKSYKIHESVHNFLPHKYYTEIKNCASDAGNRLLTCPLDSKMLFSKSRDSLKCMPSKWSTVNNYTGTIMMPSVWDLEFSQRWFIKSSIFWNITPCSPLKVNRPFGGTCRRHL